MRAETEFRSRVLTLVFTDLAGSTALKANKGDLVASQLIQRHQAHVHRLVGEHAGHEIDSAGDGFFLTFETPTSAVAFALQLQQVHAKEEDLPGVRVGIHMGEITERQAPAGSSKPILIEGLAVDLAARIQSLARPGQILLSSNPFNSARQRLQKERFESEVLWSVHGRYLFKGFDEPFDVGEVGLKGIALMEAPPDSEKAWQVRSEKPETKKFRSQQMEELISKHIEIGSEIEKLREEVTILISDIVGYTKYTNQFGDIAGRVLAEKHNRAFRSGIESYGGEYVKRIGDAVMLRFRHANGAVKMACAVLSTLDQENRDLPEDQRLHLRIGIATGRALIEENDVDGEVVNLSSRLGGLAPEDGILTSVETVKELEPYLAGLCVPQVGMAVRGIEKRKTKIYQVIWDLESPADPGTVQEVLLLEVTREGQQLKQSLQLEGRSKETVTHYEFLPWESEIVEKASLEITQTLKHDSKTESSRGFEVLKAAGKSLYDVLITPKIKEDLKKTKIEFLVVKIQDSLVSIPWELLHDGEAFLSERFAIGRRVASRREPKQNSRPYVLRPRITILSDPKHDLASARIEGEELAAKLSPEGHLNVAMKQDADLDSTRKAIQESDLVHFCGHADYYRKDPKMSGWSLADGKLTGTDILKMAGSHSLFPRAIFANACQSGRSEEWVSQVQEQVYGLASAFLHAGVLHYIGTLGDVLDASSREFAGEFYKSLMRGSPIGIAVRDARRKAMQGDRQDALIWASYLLYGDPSVGIFGVARVPSPEKTTEEAGPAFVTRELDAARETKAMEMGTVRTGTAVLPARRAAKSKSILFALAAIAVIVMSLVATFGLKDRGGSPSSERLPAADDTVALLDYLSKRKTTQDEDDRWTSRPLTLAIMPLEKEGDFAAVSPEPRRTYDFLYEQLARSGGVQLVERQKINEVLAELNLGSSDLADPKVRAQLGRLLFARFLATGALTAEGSDRMLAVRVFDCETTAVIAFGRVSGATESAATAQGVVEQIVPGLRETYPLKGKIARISGDDIYVNIGNDVGIREKQNLLVYEEMEDPLLSGLRKEIGRVEITQVGDGVSLAKVMQRNGVFKEGLKVEAAEAVIEQSKLRR